MGMMDKIQVKYDIERCISHVPDACRDCSHYTGTVGFGCMEDLLADALALLKEQKEQIKNRDESLEKAREEIKWLRGMLKEQEAVVRCIYCKRRGTYDCPVYVGGDGMNSEPDDWYCADGERKMP